MEKKRNGNGNRKTPYTNIPFVSLHNDTKKDSASPVKSVIESKKGVKKERRKRPTKFGKANTKTNFRGNLKISIDVSSMIMFNKKMFTLIQKYQTFNKNKEIKALLETLFDLWLAASWFVSNALEIAIDARLLREYRVRQEAEYTSEYNNTLMLWQKNIKFLHDEGCMTTDQATDLCDFLEFSQSLYSYLYYSGNKAEPRCKPCVPRGNWTHTCLGSWIQTILRQEWLSQTPETLVAAFPTPPVTLCNYSYFFAATEISPDATHLPREPHLHHEPPIILKKNEAIPATSTTCSTSITSTAVTNLRDSLPSSVNNTVFLDTNINDIPDAAPYLPFEMTHGPHEVQTKCRESGLSKISVSTEIFTTELSRNFVDSDAEDVCNEVSAYCHQEIPMNMYRVYNLFLTDFRRPFLMYEARLNKTNLPHTVGDIIVVKDEHYSRAETASEAAMRLKSELIALLDAYTIANSSFDTHSDITKTEINDCKKTSHQREMADESTIYEDDHKQRKVDQESSDLNTKIKMKINITIKIISIINYRTKIMLHNHSKFHGQKATYTTAEYYFYNLLSKKLLNKTAENTLAWIIYWNKFILINNMQNIYWLELPWFGSIVESIVNRFIFLCEEHAT